MRDHTRPASTSCGCIASATQHLALRVPHYGPVTADRIAICGHAVRRLLTCAAVGAILGAPVAPPTPTATAVYRQPAVHAAQHASRTGLRAPLGVAR